MADTPNIRFEGFAGAWELRKLGDVCEFLNGDRSENYPASSDFQESGIPFVGSDALGDTEINMEKVRFISKDKYEVMKGIKIQEGDILYTLRGAGFGKNSLANFNGGTVASSLVGIRCVKENTVSVFLTQWFNSMEANKEKAQAVNGSTAQNISVDDMKKYSISIPTIDEQKRLGVYFHNLDHLITLHQHKCDETKELKKYMLQKMFPQNGEKIPEIRFAGFNGEWEQRKLSDVVNVYDGVHQTPEYQDSGIMFLSVENIATLKSGKYISEEAFERDYKVYPEKGDILMTRIGDVGTTNVVESTEKIAFYVSLALMKTIEIDSYFLSNSMKTNGFQKGLREHTLVTAIPQKINKDEIGKVSVWITDNHDEQKRIGEYFKSLDHLIILHQRKCDELKEVKKFMLQNMFPQKG